ncbi:MAG: GNAT family N-acetyltransferase [Thermoplasmata archaeon]
MATENAAEKSEKKNERAAVEPAVPRAAEVKVVKPLVIERLTHEDVADIVSLFRKVWDPYLVGLPPEVQRAWQPTPLEFTSGMEGVTYFSAKRDKQLIGVVGCAIHAGSCHLLNLAVDVEHRRHGIGTALLAAATGWAQHAQTKSLYVEVLARFQDAMALLTASGFTKAGTLHRHFWGEDVELFEKTL